MTPHDAAADIRDSINLTEVDVELRHNVKFVEQVMSELGIEQTIINFLLVGRALEKAKIEADDIEYPKMFYTRDEPKEGSAAVYIERGKYWQIAVENDEEATKLGKGWSEDVPEELPEQKTEQAAK